MERIGVCASCGARFKIPETFKGSSAPCKKCDGVIKIGPAQPAAAAAPAAPAARSAPAPAPKVAAARPSVRTAADDETVIDRPARSSRVEARSGSSRRPARGAAPPARKGRRGSDGDDKKKSPMVLVGAVAGGLVLIGVVGFMLMNGDDAPKVDPTVSANSGTNAATSGTSEAAAPVAGTESAGAPKSAPEPSTSKDGALANAKTEAPTPAPEAGTPEAAPAETPNPDGEVDAEVHSKFEFTAVEKAPGTTDAEWTELTALAEKLKDSGAPRKRALKKLIPFGLKAVPICINSLNGLDLTDANQWVTGYEIAVFIQNDLTAETILIPYHGDFSSETAEINRNHKVLTSILTYWNAQSSDPNRWEALVAKYEEKKASKGSNASGE